MTTILDWFQPATFESFENVFLFLIKFAHRIHLNIVWMLCGLG
jgi:hypothetical protein